METERVIYTDGHDVKVTSHKLIVRKSEYRLDGITAFRVFILKANKAVPVLLMLLGLVTLVAGLMKVLPVDAMNPVNAGGKLLDLNDIAAITGGLLFLAGIILMIAVQDRYAVQITTAEGNKNVILSTKRDYVNQIVAALTTATTPVL